MDNDKTSVQGRAYDLKNAEKFLLEILTKKICKNKALELYNDLIKPDIDALMKLTSRGKDRRENILEILNKLESTVFDGVYIHYDKVSELETEESIAERNQLRRKKLNEIAENEERISLKLIRIYFGYYSQVICIRFWATQKIQKETKFNYIWLKVTWII